MTEIESDERQQDSQQAREIYQENQRVAKSLSPELQKFFKDSQLYFYTTVEPSIEVEHELESLVQRLKIAENRGISAEEVLGMNGPDYCKKTLQNLDVTYYHHELGYYSKYIILFLVFTFTIYSLFEFFRGLFYYGNLGSALNMPISFSILGIPLQILTVISALFFFFQYRRSVSFESTWYKDNNLLYLLASIVSIIASLIVPFVSLYYNVLVINSPVWLVFTVIIFTYIYMYIFPRINIDKYIDRRIALRNSTAANESKATTDAQDTQSDLEKDISGKEPTRIGNLWYTIKAAGPILTRETYRKEKKKLDKEKEDKK